jgi:hypothetical protein
MRTVCLGLLATVWILAGCHRRESAQGEQSPPGQWILESYDVNSGYVFRKDGVRYYTHCSSQTYPGETFLDGIHRLTGDFKGKVPEGTCFDVTRFMHKPVPLKLTQGTNVLYYDSQDAPGTLDPPGTSYYFIIVAEK